MAAPTKLGWLIFLAGFTLLRGCGFITHIEISHRATEFFQGVHVNNTDYRNLIIKNQDAFQAGSIYPDAFYSSLCQKGNYHNVSEDTHWTPFLNASIEYIRSLPKPWDRASEKLVVFVLGVASHQVADVVWHSLGIDQGFLEAMGKVDFHGSFSAAHDVGDVGGDILNMYQLNIDYLNSFDKWYIPVKDLLNIYHTMYRADAIPAYVIEECSEMIVLATIGEELAIAKLFPDYADKSGFMVDRLYDYFLGGMDDMAVWSQEVWHETIHMLEHGTTACSVPNNPVFINCSILSSRIAPIKGGRPEVNGYTPKAVDCGLTLRDLRSVETLRGVTIEASDDLKTYIHRNRQDIMQRKHSRVSDKQRYPTGMYTTKIPYSKLGWTVISGDLNGDAREDLVVGIPGYSTVGNTQAGRVCVIYSTAEGLPRGDLILEDRADVIIDVPFKILGSVFLYYGSSTGLPSQPNTTLSCSETNCNFGWSLASGHLDSDGFPDLVIGTPYAPGEGQQKGMVAVLLSGSNVSDVTFASKFPIEESGAIVIRGEQNYSWFGQSLLVDSNKNLLVGAPTFRLCARKDCVYSENDTQAVGKLYVYDFHDNRTYLRQTVTGEYEFGRFGSSMSIGTPVTRSQSVLAISAPYRLVEASVGISVPFPQAGTVMTFNTSSKIDILPQTQWFGDRMFDRFGLQMMFANVSGDGLSDLLVTSPLRSSDVSEEIYGAEEGLVYIYKSGPGFPRGNATLGNCGSFAIRPCPEKNAYAVLSLSSQPEVKARFGSSITVTQSGNASAVVVGAVHSSSGARLSGALAVFSFP